MDLKGPVKVGGQKATIRERKQRKDEPEETRKNPSESPVGQASSVNKFFLISHHTDPRAPCSPCPSPGWAVLSQKKKLEDSAKGKQIQAAARERERERTDGRTGCPQLVPKSQRRRAMPQRRPK